MLIYLELITLNFKISATNIDRKKYEYEKQKFQKFYFGNIHVTVSDATLHKLFSISSR